MAIGGYLHGIFIQKKAEQKFFESFKVWCWRRMLQLNWTERKTNESVLNETRIILSTIRDRRWNLIRHDLKYGEQLLYITIVGKINGKRTSYIKKMISDVGLTNRKELKRLADNRDEQRNYRKLQGSSQKKKN